jgi:hypothetical protein
LWPLKHELNNRIVTINNYVQFYLFLFLISSSSYVAKGSSIIFNERFFHPGRMTSIKSDIFRIWNTVTPLVQFSLLFRQSTQQVDHCLLSVWNSMPHCVKDTKTGWECCN